MRSPLDTTNECVQALNAMGIKMGDADPIVASFLIIRKLDKEGILLYEQTTRKSKETSEEVAQQSETSEDLNEKPEEVEEENNEEDEEANANKIVLQPPF